MKHEASFPIFGRGGGIRTRDPLHPMQVRYQAALRPDKLRIIDTAFEIAKAYFQSLARRRDQEVIGDPAPQVEDAITKIFQILAETAFEDPLNATKSKM